MPFVPHTSVIFLFSMCWGSFFFYISFLNSKLLVIWFCCYDPYVIVCKKQYFFVHCMFVTYFTIVCVNLMPSVPHTLCFLYNTPCFWSNCYWLLTHIYTAQNLFLLYRMCLLLWFWESWCWFLLVVVSKLLPDFDSLF